jgi:heme oxygenase (biliverdin-IX-beta and delta-forming)
MQLVMPADDSIALPGFEHGGLRERLKQATSPAHRRLDAQLSGFDLTSVDGYRRFLEASAAALLPIEEALERAGVGAIFDDWPSRSRRAVIAADIRSLGGTVRSLPDIGALNRYQVIGTMYVLEGSRLGAKVLLKAVAASADSTIMGATRYLRHGVGLHLWRSFIDMREREAAAAEDEAEMFAGARRAFATFATAAARA